MKYNSDTCAVELSAYELCFTALKQGDLGGYFYRTDSHGEYPELYYKLQAEAGAYYATDTELCNTVRVGDIYCTVSTRADGIIRRGEEITVDKIKCVKGGAFWTQPDDMTLGLLRCAAYFVAVRDGLRVVDGRVSYYNTESRRLKYFKYKFLLKDLESFYFSMIERIAFRISLCVQRATKELPIAENARFPYSELREGQETMIRECYSAIKHGERVFVEAPTGTGKTISSLFPAVRALGKELCHKIFYLTPKTATRKEAFAAAARLHSGGVLTRTVVLTSKEQMCCSGCCSGANACSPRCCEYARGYYDRVDGALKEMLDNYRGYSRGLILETARVHRVCPYELSLDLSELCDIIICDYNYAFDPSVYLRRYFGAEGRIRDEKYVFLVDEAHNLADRARDMYSAELRMSRIEAVRDGCGDEEISLMLTPLMNALKGMKRLCRNDIIRDAAGNEQGFYIASEIPTRLMGAITSFYKKCGEWCKKNNGSPFAEILMSLNTDIRRYITVSEYFDNSFRFYAQIGEGDICVRIYCLDPSAIMASLLTRAVSSVMFSATLTPPEYFCDVLGGGKNAQKICLPSPFSTEKLCVAVADYVNTRFDSREDNAKRFATVIAAAVNSRVGNYIAYFPSYQCLEQTYKAFAARYPKVETVVQKRNMTYAQREEFLLAFKEDTGHMRVGFCVLGGVFSEGVDLPGSRLIGSVIFGVGLPGLSNERNIVKEHFDMKSDDGSGYDYAYTFPGMNNVLQAAGRVIRTDGDRGVVVLADDRYAIPKYRALFPKHWQGVQYAGNASSLAEIIRRFWENQV